MTTVKQLHKALSKTCDRVHISLLLPSPPLPRAVTIASVDPIDTAELSRCTHNAARVIARGEMADGESIGAFMKHRLAEYGFSCVAVCSRNDVFNQTRGEIIALGRLLKSQRKHDLLFDQRIPARCRCALPSVEHYKSRSMLEDTNKQVHRQRGAMWRDVVCGERTRAVEIGCADCPYHDRRGRVLE